MRYRELMEAMSPATAAAIFKKAGVDNADGLDAKALKAARTLLSKRYHADAGGDHDTMANINAAYDALTKERAGGAASSSRRAPEPPEERGTPPWAWAGYSGGAPPSGRISRRDYTDLNYIKQQMWELSDHSNKEWSLHGFDGHFLRNSLTVYGSPVIFRDMAQAMVTWQTWGSNSYECRAVLVSRRGNREWQIIWADGIDYDENPLIIEHESFNDNAGNDPSFTRRLTALLDQLQQPATIENDKS